MFPAILFEDRKPLPNLMICLNSAKHGKVSFDSNTLNPGSTNDLVSLDPRYFLPLANNARIFHIRNIMLFGADPASYPALEYALKCFSGRVEHIGLVIHPGQSLGIDPNLIPLIQEISYLIPPVFWEDYQGDIQILQSLETEISGLRRENPKLHVQAMLYVSALNLSKLDRVIEIIENEGFDRLHFFPPNLYLALGEGRSPEAIDPKLIPSREMVETLERDFWNFLEKPCFETRLFDLNVCRRQLERILEFFKAAVGLGDFSPPYCRASRISLFIEPTGVTRCCPYQKTIGDLTKKSLIEIRESEERRLFQTNLNLAKNPLCPVCPGVYPHLLWRSR